jgi:DNA-binding response OmpR family regulator
VAVNRYDVVVLDRDLPGVHGDDVCRALAAERSPSRVLMLTAARSVKDRVEGLGLGADDYLPKPFDFAELVARIRALARRAATPLPVSLEHGDLSVDPARRVAVRAGRRLPLTPKELAVLECLLAADGRPVSAEELLERVWDEVADPFTSTVKTTVRQRPRPWPVHRQGHRHRSRRHHRRTARPGGGLAIDVAFPPPAPPQAGRPRTADTAHV